MEKVSFSEFRRDPEAIIRKVRRGKRLVLTYRGKPAMRLVPIGGPAVSLGDPFYLLGELTVEDRRSLTNAEIDRIVYES